MQSELPTLLLTPLCVSILTRGDLPASQHRLLWLLAAQLRGGVAVVSLTDLAERAGLSRLTAVRSVHALLRLGLLVRGARVGTSYQYKLNPAYLKVL